MWELQQCHHDDGGSPSPLQFPFPFQLDSYFLHRFSPGRYHGNLASVPSVRWPCSGAFTRARSGYFQNYMPLGKPKRRVEDDEEVIEKAPYLCPVAGLVTRCGREK